MTILVSHSAVVAVVDDNVVNNILNVRPEQEWVDENFVNNILNVRVQVQKCENDKKLTIFRPYQSLPTTYINLF